MLCGTGALEDEAHFVVSCEIYRELRMKMFENIRKKTGWDWAIMLDDPRWVLEAALGCGVGGKQTRQGVYPLVARFIRAALDMRGKMLEYFRTLKEDSRQDKLDSALLLGRQEGGAGVQYDSSRSYLDN